MSDHDHDHDSRFAQVELRAARIASQTPVGASSILGRYSSSMELPV
jgi:hypothetical protein